MKIKIGTSKLIEAIETISQSFKANCKIDCEEAVLHIPDQCGEGTIKGINFGNGLGLFTLNCQLKKPLTLQYKLAEPYPLRAVFCQEGNFIYKFENCDIKYKMQALKSSITASSDHKNQSLELPADVPLVITFLEIDRLEYMEKLDCDLKSVPEDLARVFRDLSYQDPFLYKGDYSLSISETVNLIHNNDFIGLVRKAYLEAKALELFSLIIRQYKDDQNPNIRKVIIRKVDLEKIELARELLVHDLGTPFTIPELAKKVGLNENKLKKGFKQVYNTTLNQYLINKRLEYAKVLLMSGSFSITEVAEKVGYKNVSFFTRKFKAKFGILPKDFVKNNKSAISA